MIVIVLTVVGGLVVANLVISGIAMGLGLS
jgi:hypothetical protein